MKPIIKPPRNLRLQNETSNVWDQMDAITPPWQDEPGISIQEYADRYRISQKMAHVTLHKLAREGKVIMGYRRAEHNGRKMKVFRPA